MLKRDQLKQRIDDQESQLNLTRKQLDETVLELENSKKKLHREVTVPNGSTEHINNTKDSKQELSTAREEIKGLK
jgi:hypothetical protein